MIRLRGIDKYYDSRFQRAFVLKGINLEVEEGEFLSIMGPSGSGKSTLLHILGLLDSPSGGQQQLVGIARAIVGKPKLLLADEPTGNLHSKQGEMIMETLRELHSEGMTIIQVTHNDKFAAYGQRIIQLEDGMIKTG
ncbi:MAG: ABC transporter ATP-binding protein [Bacteroidales bacterium]|jgi:ABC-type lipoprotein export system ATPase subunit|nr:ATP-binding cassette domain-containing protein [Bacteroidota bacterium]